MCIKTQLAQAVTLVVLLQITGEMSDLDQSITDLDQISDAF